MLIETQLIALPTNLFRNYTKQIVKRPLCTKFVAKIVNHLENFNFLDFNTRLKSTKPLCKLH